MARNVTVNSLPLLYNNLGNKYCLDDKPVLLSLSPSGKKYSRYKKFYPPKKNFKQIRIKKKIL